MTVTLLNAAGDPLPNRAPVTTTSTGAYSFASVLPGSYRLRFDAPATYMATATGDLEITVQAASLNSRDRGFVRGE